jgi:hypothetical protein
MDSISDYVSKYCIFAEVAGLLVGGRMLDPSEAENQPSNISTFHPVSRTQGQISILQPVITKNSEKSNGLFSPYAWFSPSPDHRSRCA